MSRFTSPSRIVRPLAAAGILAVLGAAPAFAADVISEEPPAPAPIEALPVASWAGPYAGLQLGYTKGKTDTDAGNVDTDGIIGGAFAGYNWESNNVVYGLEGDVGYGDRNESENGVRSKSGIEGSLRARLGYAVTPDVLIYGTAGVAGQDLKVTAGGERDRNTLVGYTVGAGTDIKLTENVFGRVEYRYTDYADKAFDTGAGSIDVDQKDHRVQFGVGMKF
ncbi:porin family protein [Mesorhizobium sp. RP14(2022)]|uniref:Porin family protein n=1 Tax=Mesorhizobium liriopis TaxID=2953882 RepID=A0ABT1C7V3_9HYPH|nr:outer membrane protein [Mesorhizobium liriopis]MCO6050905.1 porin family protein [Mesorhizobium liriopis]